MALTSAVALASGACTTDASEIPSAVPVVASVEGQGLRVTLEVAGPVVASGAELFIGLTVQNVGTDVAFWQGGGCGLRGHVAINGGVELGPMGEQWTGDRDLLKKIAVPGGLASGRAITSLDPLGGADTQS